MAVDIGASSGRHIIAWHENGRIAMKEVYRFDNSVIEKDGKLCWDLEYLFSQIKEGLKECKTAGMVPKYMGIDTWAVDFVLLDKENKVIGSTVSYRDSRTKGMDDVIADMISYDALYEKTGIQKQIFNSIYQLKAVQLQNPEQMAVADTFLMIPDYFNFLLTGVKTVEYTNATTTQLVSPVTKNWDFELMETVGIDKNIFPEISEPGSCLGRFKEEMIEEIGFDVQVMLPATHDTGSAVLAVPCLENDVLYISSGTWSLVGVELESANCSKESMKANFTNEGGFNYRFRYLKNIMGLWMIQCVKKELGNKYSFAELCEMAEEYTGTVSKIDVNDQRFLAPESMTEQIKKCCEETGQKVPDSVGELAAVIYQNLAASYFEAVTEIEQITGKKYSTINIVGGGSNAEYLNRLTAKATQKTVSAGPVEATAIGNILAQMIGTAQFANVAEARQSVKDSFEMKYYS